MSLELEYLQALGIKRYRFGDESAVHFATTATASRPSVVKRGARHM